MYEKFLVKNLNSIRQAVDDTFIAKYADMSYAELTTLWQEAGLVVMPHGTQSRHQTSNRT